MVFKEQIVLKESALMDPHLVILHSQPMMPIMTQSAPIEVFVIEKVVIAIVWKDLLELHANGPNVQIIAGVMDNVCLTVTTPQIH